MRCRPAPPPERQPVGADGAARQPLAIALEHEDVGEQVVREQDRLGPLQVRIAGHRRVRRLARARDQGRLHGAQPIARAHDRVLEVHPLVERDLVVARAARVQLAADLADQLDEPPLDVRVDVLELGAERERAGLQLARTASRPFTIASRSASLSSRARASARAQAMLPAMSCGQSR